MFVAIWEVVCVARAGGDVPGDEAWQRASAAVRQRFEPGDLIVFAPAWNEPVGRKHLGDLITVDTAARMDAARFATIWELSIRGARAPETRGLSAVSSESFGGLRVNEYRREPAMVVTDFVAALSRATQRSGASVQLEEVGFEPHRCIKVVPRPDQTVHITFAHEQLGTQLVGYVGLADVFKRRDVRDPGRLEVSIDGVGVASVEFGVDDGWVRFEAATTPGTDATVDFAATAVGPEATDRLICFAAEARR